MSSPVRDDNAHSVFSASAAFRWAGYPGEPGCPYSAILASKLPPEVAGPAAEEGTRAHKLLELAMEEEAALPDHDRFTGRSGAWASLGGYDDGMRAAVRLTLAYVGKLKASYPKLQVWSEVQIDFMEDVGGRFDILCYDPDTHLCWVIDFKYGKQPVHPENNPQLLSYAAFVRYAFKLTAWAYYLVIIQPRDFSLEPLASPIKEWCHPMSVVEAWDEQIRRARAEADAKVCRPRADRCRRCRGAPLCEAIGGMPPQLPVQLVTPKAPRKKKGEDKQPAPPPFLTKAGEEAEPLKPKELPPSVLEQIAEALDGLPALEAYANAVQAVADELVLRQGIELPRYKDVYKEARISWDAEPKTVANELWRLGRISPADVLPAKLISITDAKALLSAAVANLDLGAQEGGAAGAIQKIWDDFAKLTKRLPSGERVVVPVTDKRPKAALVDLDRELTASAALVSPEGAEEVGK